MDTLKQLREQLDLIDADIVKLIEKRFQITDQVAIYKDKHDIPVHDFKREAELLEVLKSKISHPVLKENIGEVYEKIFQLNKKARTFRRNTVFQFTKVGIIGLGFIGGSIVKGLKMKNPEIEIYTLQRDSQDIKIAQKQNYITSTVNTLTELVNKCDLIILATPLETIPFFANELAEVQTNHEVVVMDISSVKSNITKQFEQSTKGTIEFISTHPMAGSEKTGFTSAYGMVFVNKPWIITPHSKNTKKTLRAVEELITYLGSNPIILTAEEHDRHVASVSHIVFLLSCYLYAFISEINSDSLSLTGSGFESLTRLASGSPTMHAEIVTQNYENIAVSIVSFMEFIKSQDIASDSLIEFFTKIKLHRDSFITNRS